MSNNEVQEMTGEDVLLLSWHVLQRSANLINQSTVSLTTRTIWGLARDAQTLMSKRERKGKKNIGRIDQEIFSSIVATSGVGIGNSSL